MIKVTKKSKPIQSTTRIFYTKMGYHTDPLNYASTKFCQTSFFLNQIKELFNPYYFIPSEIVTRILSELLHILLRKEFIDNIVKIRYCKCNNTMVLQRYPNVGANHNTYDNGTYCSRCSNLYCDDCIFYCSDKPRLNPLFTRNGAYYACENCIDK